MGGQVSGQLVEHVRSFDPRGWTCMHIAEGALDCRNATIRFNDIGPCGHDAPYGSWADGISMACTQSTVEGNTVVDPTDGGIVVFGALGSKVTNNTISVRNSTSLGGINLVVRRPCLVQACV
jgi:parallel beta-helix repeat protein